MNNNKQLTLSQHIHQAFFDAKGYDPFDCLKSHDAASMYDSYVRSNKIIASGLTHQDCQITFISKYIKNE